jgi:hypothetical protein
MKTTLAALLILFTLSALAHAQVEDDTTSPSPGLGFALPTVGGTLTYALTGSESLVTGYGQNTVASETTLSGDLAYLSSSPNRPFSLVYTGGVQHTTISDSGYPPVYTFQNLALSQVVATKNWNFVVDDAVSYLPDAPTTGLSGIPGVGDIGIVPVQIGDQPTQSILTNFATRVSNGLNGGVTRQITESLSLAGSASWHILHFFSNLGIDSTGEYARIGPNYRINASSSFSANAIYGYTSEQYQGTNFAFTSEGLMFQYQRQWSPNLSMSVAAGPQRLYGTGVAALYITPQIDFVADAGLTYIHKLTTASLTYTRATDAGSGVLYGGLTNTVMFAVQRQFNLKWQGALMGSYFQTSALGQVPGFNENYAGVHAGLQVSRRISPSLSGYAS